MTERRDLEQDLRSWLHEDGPQDVPARIVEAAIVEAAPMRRQRPLPGPILRILAPFAAEAHRPLHPLWPAIVMAVLLLAIGAILAGAFLFQVDRLHTNGPIAFDAAGDIYIYDPVHDDAPRRLTDTVGVEEQGPMYSPNGRYLAYWVTDVASAELHVRELDTGRTIILTDEGGLILPLDAAPFGWSPDSERLAAPARAAAADGTLVGIDSVIIFDVTTRDVERIPIYEPTWSFGWSPDGRHIGLVAQAGLMVYDVESGEVRSMRRPGSQDAIVPYARSVNPPVFTADGDAILYTQSEDASRGGDIWRVSIAEPDVEPMLIGSANDVAPVVAKAGTAFVFGRSLAITIERAFTNKDGEMPTGPERASDLLVVSAPEATPTTVATNVWPRAEWSPDGRWLVTKSFEGELVLIDIERPEPPLKVPLHASIGGFSWGPRPP